MILEKKHYKVGWQISCNNDLCYLTSVIVGALRVPTQNSHSNRAKRVNKQIIKTVWTTMPGVVVNDQRKTIRTIFQESQRSVATHRKLVNSLRTLQATCWNQNQEELFTNEFLACLSRVLPIKKSEPTADRVVKFIGHFIQHVQEKGELVVLDCLILLSWGPN